MSYSEHFPVTYYFYPLLDGVIDGNPHRKQFEDVWSNATPNHVETLLYVHIPYCQDMCRFCPFHVRVEKDFSVYNRYTDALCKEIEDMSRTQRGGTSKIKAIYFGGGSPSVFSIEQLSRIFTAIRSNFNVLDEAEISFEGDPYSLADLDKLNFLKSQGVDRISFGLQTYDEELREAFNIKSTLRDIDQLLEHCSRVKFHDVNVDMMYNLPGQTVDQINSDIEKLIRDGVDSVDYYALHYFAFPPKFKRKMESGEIPSKPNQATMHALFEHLKYKLGSAGYKNVADQVYSKHDEVCEYFRLLWGGGYGQYSAETLAVGSSARGYVDGFTYMNHGNVNKYMASVENGSSCVEKISSRLLDVENRGAVLFPKFLSISKEHIEAIDTIPKGMIEGWVDSGYLYTDRNGYSITELGKIWTNNMTTDLFESAQREVGDKAVLALHDSSGSRTGTF